MARWIRPLGATGLQVSALGLGSVQLGRDLGLKYPGTPVIPGPRQARLLLDKARQLEINLIDTAPAYGDSERRLGELLRNQAQHWLLCTKVGEEFNAGQSQFDFSPESVCASVERSLLRLRRDTLDIVLVHSDGRDQLIIDQYGTLQALQELQKRGWIQAVGFSPGTVAGAHSVVSCCDVVMLTHNLTQPAARSLLDKCHAAGTGVLIKKPLASGYQVSSTAIEQGMELIFSHPGVNTAVVGTTNPLHLQTNVDAARRALSQAPPEAT